jgi:hypothetical protein
MNTPSAGATLRALALFAALIAAPAATPAATPETIELFPNERAGWTAGNLLAPLTALFLGPSYWYGERTIEVETTPPGALLELFYVRANVQKAYEQGEAPATLLLPRRIDTTPRDSVTIRVLADGYRQKDVHIPVRSRQGDVLIELEPLANTLVAMAHLTLAGRSSLTFLTREAPNFRLQKASQGLSIVLVETAVSADAASTIQGVHSALIEQMTPQQLGEDLVVRLKFGGSARTDEIETRSRQAYDAVRNLHAFTLDLVPSDDSSPVQSARAALARIRAGDVTGCAVVFDAALREQLETAALSRALTPRGEFTDRYLRAALKRLGEVSPGSAIAMRDGTKYSVAIPVELAAAASQPAEAIGYLALLRAFVGELEPELHRREALRGLIAPEVGPSRFDAILGTAEIREQRCRTGSG